MMSLLFWGESLFLEKSKLWLSIQVLRLISWMLRSAVKGCFSDYDLFVKPTDTHIKNKQKSTKNRLFNCDVIHSIINLIPAFL